ncbi:unnamed protein product [Cuscuta epithymum]|uniref:Structure-specific endonuclease subunit SLX1 homolog n=1 Tax=Cuscuta epithymum TaxID=186058 RepID=A0AAV0CFN7_9ASTE|nr:unnamed protein product [Cuscuta epithymum]
MGRKKTVENGQDNPVILTNKRKGVGLRKSGKDVQENLTTVKKKRKGLGETKTVKDVQENLTILKKKRKGVGERETGKDAQENQRCDNEGGSGFFACYLLTSLSPRFKGFTYIGFTINPRRRIRQHNGEISSGAVRTKRRRPWEMVLCIYGFPTHGSALQFEWAWQHPRESLAVREAVGSLKTLVGLGSKIKLAYMMLTLTSWMNLTVNFFSTKYTKHAAGCPNLPEQMKVRVCSMDDLPCYSGINWDSCEHDDDEYANDDDHDDDHDDDECDGIGGTQESACSQSSGNEERIEQNASWEHDLMEQLIIENHKWEQENNRSSSFTDFHGASSSPFLFKSINIIGNNKEDDEPSFVETNKLPEEIVIEDQNPCLATDNHTCEVEIIDICTPPPCKFRSESDNIRFSSACSELIIDLTQSPIFV